MLLYNYYHITAHIIQ